MKLYGLDLETDDPYLTDRGASWVYGKGSIICTGLYDAEAGKKQALRGNGGKTVVKLLKNPEAVLVGANIAYDLGWLCCEHKIPVDDVRCRFIDIGIAEQFIDEYQPYRLDSLARKYLGEQKGSGSLPSICASLGYRDDFRRHLKELWDTGYKDEILAYAASDADQPVRIWEAQRQIIEAEETMPALETNFALIKIVAGMKQRGVRIDIKKWRENSAKLAVIYERLQKDFVEKYGKVNINSSPQLGELFTREGVPFRYKITIKGRKPVGRKFTAGDWFTGDAVWRERRVLRENFNGIRVQKDKLVLFVPRQYAGRTNGQIQALGYETTCNPNINKYALRAAKNAHPVAAAVADLKQAKNIIDKFLGPKFERFLVRDASGDWRLHGNFNPVGARRTGRFSSALPNLQNVPSKTVLYEGTADEMNLAQVCREVFLPERGEVLVKLDFSGQENRLQAHFAVGKNGKYIRARYNANPRLDEHSFVGEISGLYAEYGKKRGRKFAKNYRFGRGYGMQIQTMMENFGWTREEAERITEMYDNAAPWVKETMEEIQDLLLGRGRYEGKGRRYIKTFSRRRVRLREGRDRDAYKFYNYLIQGSAADMIKEALVKIAESKTVEKLLLTVHDENVFSVPCTAAGMRRIAELQECMEHAVELLVPVVCDPEIGMNWWDVEGQEENKETGEREPLDRFLRRMLKVKGVKGVKGAA
jgi:DNA polymerase I-like protein with 3'-5' exonuclease and polymerase domains